MVNSALLYKNSPQNAVFQFDCGIFNHFWNMFLPQTYSACPRTTTYGAQQQYIHITISVLITCWNAFSEKIINLQLLCRTIRSVLHITYGPFVFVPHLHASSSVWASSLPGNLGRRQDYNSPICGITAGQTKVPNYCRGYTVSTHVLPFHMLKRDSQLLSR